MDAKQNKTKSPRISIVGSMGEGSITPGISGAAAHWPPSEEEVTTSGLHLIKGASSFSPVRAKLFIIHINL